MTYFFITGETSGSNYAAEVVDEIKKIDPQAKFYGLGGEILKNAGCEIIIPLERLAFMGFSAVIKNIFTVRKNFKQTKQAILDIKPDVVCLVDYPGFNLKMAKWCKENGFKTAYYILPKVWAWNEKRINILEKYCDALIGIFPFEVDYFKQRNINIYYFGNPLSRPAPQRKDAQWMVNNTLASQNRKTAKPHIALLPGSRKQEIQALMPVFMELAHALPDERFKVVALEKYRDIYPPQAPPIQGESGLEYVFDTVGNVARNSKFAVVCSGTATLEIALLKVPQVIVYKTNFINYYIAKKLIKVPYIGLPNIIVNQCIVPELIQYDCTAENIKQHISKFSNKNVYQLLEEKLLPENTSEKVAKLLAGLMENGELKIDV
jgi:lipid-A-disaccharide synthase